MATLQLGDLLFAGRRGAGAGTRFYFRGLKDWFSLSDSKSDVVERAQADGAFGIAVDYRNSLAPSFEGFYSGVSRADALEKQRTLKAIAATRGAMLMSLTDEDGTFRRSVSLRRIDIDDIRHQRVFTFTVYTVAPDPRMYGDTDVQTTGLPVVAGGLIWPITWPITWAGGGATGRVEITNAGTADTAPQLEVTGGLGLGFTLDEVGSGRQVRFDREVPLGSTVFLNPRTGRAYIDTPNNDVSGYLTRQDWPSAPAGGSTVLQFNALGVVTGTPTLTARTAPAYW